jgi:hypothetical protein
MGGWRDSKPAFRLGAELRIAPPEKSTTSPVSRGRQAEEMNARGAEEQGSLSLP